MVRQIVVVTGTRADYGLLRGTLREMQAAPDMALRLVVTGAHLEPRFGETWRAIVADGFAIDDRIPMGIGGDSPADIAAAMGQGLVGLVEAFTRSPPDMVLLLGDRYEALIAAQAATLCRLPIGHIHGGERTEGAMDEVFRHAITKMAHLHFAACDEYRRRIIQLGEHPSRVFDVGAPGIDNISELDLAGQAELEEFLGMSLERGFVLVTYHPVTLAEDDGIGALEELLAALDAIPDLAVVVTGVNADPGRDAVAGRLATYAATCRDRVRLVESLGDRRYLGAMRLCRAVVGNSSSGIIEAPFLRVPTVNIGSRQHGRVRAASVIDCDERRQSISEGVRMALSPGFRAGLADFHPPFGTGGAARRIVQVLRGAPLASLVGKSFFDIPDILK